MRIPTHPLSVVLYVLSYVIPIIGFISGMVLIKKTAMKKIGAVVVLVSIVICVAFIFFVVLGLG